MTQITTQITKTMTSLELLEVINKYRELDGKDPMRHSNFLQKIEDEFEGGELKFQSSYLSSQNKELLCYKLPKIECMIMAMRESKAVRRQAVNDLETIPLLKEENLQLGKEVARLRTELVRVTKQLVNKNRTYGAVCGGIETPDLFNYYLDHAKGVKTKWIKAGYINSKKNIFTNKGWMYLLDNNEALNEITTEFHEMNHKFSDALTLPLINKDI